MTAIVVCECGAKIRVSAKNRGRAVKCPSCQQGLVLDSDGQVLTAGRSHGGGGAQCQICQSEIAAGETCVECPDCKQNQHRDCWAEVGGCGTYGCRQAPSVEKTPDSADAPLTAWGDTKECPACGEDIKSIALRCRYCGTDFDSVDPMTLRDLDRQSRRKDDSKQLRTNVILLFIVSIFGCLAPITLLVWIWMTRTKQAELKRCGPQFPVMAWSALSLSALYTVLILFFAISGNLV